MRTIPEHYSWLFGVPMDMPVVEEEAEEDEEDDVGSSLSSRMKRTALKTRLGAQRTRPLPLSEMDQYMHMAAAAARVTSTLCQVWTGGGRWSTWDPSDPSCLRAFESTP